MVTQKDTFIHVPAFPTAEFHAMVKPNVDTLYSREFLGLHPAPRVVSIPADDLNYLPSQAPHGSANEVLPQLEAGGP